MGITVAWAYKLWKTLNQTIFFIEMENEFLTEIHFLLHKHLILFFKKEKKLKNDLELYILYHYKRLLG